MLLVKQKVIRFYASKSKNENIDTYEAYLSNSYYFNQRKAYHYEKMPEIEDNLFVLLDIAKMVLENGL